MQILQSALQIFIALCLLNVWVLRFRRRTAYRGGDAGSMKEEFASYGLPEWLMYVIGALKIGIAVCFLAGLWFHPIVLPAGLLLCVLMLGALAMHAKIRDPLTKSLPALAVLVFSATLCWLATR
jgi:hypothetical protein